MRPGVKENGKPAWPLMLVAACSFIPFLGFVFGAIAVTWGLVSQRRRAMLTVMIGGAALLNIAGIFLLAWQLDRSDVYDQARVEATRLDLARLIGALESYHDPAGTYPQHAAGSGV